MLISSHHNDLRPTLSLLWLFAILNIIFRDIHEFTMASTINEILSGTVNGNPMTETVLLYGAVAVELLLLAFLLTALLPPAKARLLNLVMVPITLLGMAIVPPADPDDIFFALIVFTALAAIFILAWRWSPHAQAKELQRGRHAL